MEDSARARPTTPAPPFRDDHVPKGVYVDEPRDDEPERGAVLLIVAMLTVVLILSAGFAVDIGAWYTRAEELQQAADSAALAGAADFVSSNYDQTVAQNKVDEILRQNGLDPADPDITVNTTFDPVTGRVGVEVGDEDVDIFFSRLVQADMGIARSAMAEQDTCGSSCVHSVEIPPPLGAVGFAGSGDGWAPMLLGERVFAINHHSEVETGGDIVCVDRQTEAMCTGYPKNISPLQPAGTDWTVPVAVVGSQIFYHAQRANDFVLGCFDVSIDDACGGGHIVLANLTDPGGDHDYQSRGGGTILAEDGRIFVFSEEETFCVDPETYTSCTGYPQANGFADSGIVAGTLSGAQQSSLQLGDRIYVSHTWYLEQTGLGVQLHCWDTVADDACAGFGAVSLHPSDDPSTSGRLFAMRTPAGAAYGVCSMQRADVVCVDTDGISLPDPPGFEAAWAPLGAFKIGTPFYHDRSNRLFVPSRTTNHAFCYDFAFQTDCGTLSTGTTGDYGYASEGDCIYGLGHNSIFWTFSPDLVAGCRSSVAEDRIYACLCGDGTRHWGSVGFDADLDSTFGPFEKVEVVISDPAENVLLDLSMMDTDGVINLDGISTAHTYLNIEITIVAKAGFDPWIGGDGPVVEVGWRDRPHLVG